MEAQQQEPTAKGAQDDAAHGLSDDAIRSWAWDGSVAKKIAADLAVSIKKGTLSRWGDLPGNTGLANDYCTSIRTVSRAKKLLADCGLIQKAGSRYFVA